MRKIFSGALARPIRAGGPRPTSLPVPARTVFFGKVDNTSMEVIFRNMLRRTDIQRFLDNYFSKHCMDQSYPESKLPIKIAPPACVSDPHRVLRLFSCLAYPVLNQRGEQEVWYPENHRDRHHHSRGVFGDKFHAFVESEQHRRQDNMLHRGQTYEGDEDYPFPSDDARGHPLFWCEHYKIRVIHGEAITYLAEELLKTMGRMPTPEAADQVVDELYEGVDPTILQEYRAMHQRMFDELTFYRPTFSRQWLEYIQVFQPNTTCWGGHFSAYTKDFRIMSPRRDDVDELDPNFMFINAPVNDEALRQPHTNRMRFY
eukprot:TRINITY_DN33681_c0_g1_i1.p2 TRINITY_DN33681_c0_g1~~TRINITY_DN33681_c0_g1_i1.p2  ORF type:complete len:315 (-),score=65.22 TRINITY_DN33681_c0_g1_i1:704-1648(-)